MRKLFRVERPREQTAFAWQLYQLLQGPTKGKPQNGDDYRRAIRIKCSDFEDHLYGGVVLAVACVTEGLANFLGWDNDERMAERLAIFRKVLARRGFAQGAFVTTGSTPGAAKSSSRWRSASRNRSLFVWRGPSETTWLAPDFGAVEPGSLTCFPTGGDGKYCRILGRKYGDPSPLRSSVTWKVSG